MTSVPPRPCADRPNAPRPSALREPTPTRSFAQACIGVVALAALLLVSAGCLSFSEPVASGDASEVDLEPLLGAWVLEGDEVIELSVSGDGQLQGYSAGYTSYGEDPIAFTVRLTYIGDRLVLSARYDPETWGPMFGVDDEPGWGIAELRTSDDGESITILPVDHEALFEAVESGTLDAQLPDQGDEDYFGPPLIQVDGLELRRFLEENDQLFAVTRPSGESLHMERPEPGWREATAVAESGREATTRAAATASLALATERALALPTVYRESGASGQSGAYGGYPGYGTQVPRAVQDGAAYPGAVRGSRVTPSPAPWYPTQQAPGDLTAMPQDDDLRMPPPLKNLVVILGAVLVSGILAIAAVDHVRRGSRRADRAAAGSDRGAPSRRGWDDGEAFGPGSGPMDVVRLYAWPIVLIAAVAVGPIVLLAVLLHGLAFPEADLSQSAGAQALLQGFAPFVLVFSFGALVGLAEIVATYPSVPAAALRATWSVVLVLFNALASVLVFSAVMTGLGGAGHPVVWAFVVGVGLAVLIRTHFVLARDLSGEEDGEGISLDVGWIYGRFQHLCRERIERRLVRNPQFVMEKLLEVFEDREGLASLATRVCNDQPLDELEDALGRLETILDDDVDDGYLRARLARLVIELSTPDDVQFVIEHAGSEGGSAGDGSA